MSRHRQIERSQSITPQRIRSALKDNRTGSEGRDSWFHDCLEESEVALVVDSILERYVEREVFAESVSYLVDGSGSWKEVSGVLVEGDGEDSIRLVEGFLNSISVVDVDVDVEDSGTVSELQRRKEV